MPDVTINYEGSAIASMSASGTKTLLTAGKYCDDDIEVVYVSPGGSPVLQAKTGIVPGTSSITVTPDVGYDGLSSVQIDGDADLVAGNIKKDVTIFNVTGTYEGGGGGGGSILSASVTFAQDTLTVTLNDFAGTSLEHFFLTVDGPIQTAALGSSVRRFGTGYICYTSGKENFYTIATNGNGDNMNAIAKGNTAGVTSFNFNRTTGVLTLVYGANYGYLAGGVTYNFYMW